MQFALLLAALGHDTAHDGVSNGFHIAVGSEHARLYNDLSPLENMHCVRHSCNRELYRCDDPACAVQPGRPSS